MKKSIKTIGALSLGVFTLLGLGIASVSNIGANAIQVNAATSTISFTNIGADLGSTSNDTMSTFAISPTSSEDEYTFNYLQGKKQNNAILLAKSTDAFIANSTAIPGSISSVKLYINSGASGKTTYHCAFTTSACTSAYTTGSTAVNIAGGNNNTYSCSVTGARYFCISLGNAYNGQVLGFDITYTTVENPSITELSLESEVAITTSSTSKKLDMTISSQGGASTAVTWESSNESVATVSDDGTVTPLSKGKSVITCTSTFDSSFSKTCDVYVLSNLGTSTDPLDVTGAKELAGYAGDTQTKNKYYVTGKVESLGAANTVNQIINLYGGFQLYKMPYGTVFTKEGDILTHDLVVANGSIMTYNGTCEMVSSGSSVISIQHETPTLAIKSNPNKVEYNEGEVFDTTGLEITATFIGCEPEDVSLTDCTITPSTAFKASDESVTISYRGATVIIPVSVRARIVDYIYVANNPTKTEYSVGSKTLKTEGIVVKAHYNFGDDTDVTTDCEFSAPDFSSLGNKTITVTHKSGKTCTFIVEVVELADGAIPNGYYYISTSPTSGEGFMLSSTKSELTTFKKDAYSNSDYSKAWKFTHISNDNSDNVYTITNGNTVFYSTDTNEGLKTSNSLNAADYGWEVVTNEEDESVLIQTTFLSSTRILHAVTSDWRVYTTQQGSSISKLYLNPVSTDGSFVKLEQDSYLVNRGSSETVRTIDATGDVTWSIEGDSSFSIIPSLDSYSCEVSVSEDAALFATAQLTATVGSFSYSTTIIANDEVSYARVSNVSDLDSGDHIIIVGQYTNGYKVAQGYNAGKNFLTAQSVSVSEDGNAITSNTLTPFTVSKNSEGKYSFSSGSNTLSATGSGKMSYSGDGVNTWNVSFSEGKAQIQNTNTAYGYLLYNYNNNDSRFTTYSSANTSVTYPYIFKAVDIKPLIELIDKIPNVTRSNYNDSDVTSAIEAAEDAFLNLPSFANCLVSNYEKLNNASNLVEWHTNVNEFINAFMHTEVETTDVGTGLCITAGWFNEAIAAYNDNEILSNDERVLFQAEYQDYYVRLEAWAAANGKTLSVDSETGLITVSGSSKAIKSLATEETALTSVVTAVAIGSITLVGGLTLSRKRKEF